MQRLKLIIEGDNIWPVFDYIVSYLEKCTLVESFEFNTEHEE